MINRDNKLVKVISFTPGKDSYGKPRKNGTSSREVEMMISVYQQKLTNDIRYTEVTTIGLTADKDITDKNQIKIGEETYEVLYVIPSHRLYQIMMKKV